MQPAKNIIYNLPGHSSNFIRVLAEYGHKGSYMSAHVLLNLLNELGKGLFFARSIINSTMQGHECWILFIL